MTTVPVWLCNDLRRNDAPALQAALTGGDDADGSYRRVWGAL